MADSAFDVVCNVDLQEVKNAIQHAMKEIVNRFDDRVILSPNAGVEEGVVATSWRHLKAYDGADPEIEEFVDIYRFRGPENVPCTY